MGFTREIINEQKNERLGLEKINNQGFLMKIIEYTNTRNIKVMFLDKHKCIVNSMWCYFEKGIIDNPYAYNIYGVAARGDKYPAKINGVIQKEYDTWIGMIKRCYDKKTKEKTPAYKDVTCCEEWLLYENFYEWLHEQENFDKWYNGKRWAVDKDIIHKGNKRYCPEFCCLTPHDVNTLFCKRDVDRGNYPLGVSLNKNKNKYIAKLSMKYDTGKRHSKHIGVYNTPEEAFYLGYKPAKENYIKQVAKIEFDNGNITKKCYDAMINYQIEITD